MWCGTPSLKVRRSWTTRLFLFPFSFPHLTPNLYAKVSSRTWSHFFLILKIEHRWTFTSSAMHYYTSILLTDSKLLPLANNIIVAEDFNFLFLNNKGYQLSHRRHSNICVLNLWCRMMHMQCDRAGFNGFNSWTMQHVCQPVVAILDSSVGFLGGGCNNLREKIKSYNLNQGFCRLQWEYNSFRPEEGNSKLL